MTSETVKLVSEEFPELTKPMSYDRPMKHDVTHSIETSALPVSCRPRQLPPEMMKIAKEQFNYMLEKGIIEPNSGPWSFPLHLVKRKVGPYRCVGDYRRLNNVTTKDSNPLPYLRDFANNLYGMTIFSAIDLQSAYHQVPLDPESMEKTTVTTPFGAFKYRRMNFGLCNATQSFQCFINKVISGMENFCFAYVDDLLVASTDAEEHKSHFRMLFQRLADYGLIINAKKNQIGQDDLEFLGYRITKGGLRPLQSRVAAICSFPRPTNVTQLRSFLGMVNFYRRFISHISDSLRHLNMMLSNEKKGSTKELDWKPEAI